MSTAIASTAPAPTQRICAYDVSWETYLHISEGLNGRHVRLTYDRGTLEFTTISLEHGFLCRFFHQLIQVLTDELGMGRKSLGDLTCQRESAQRALEPDECFYIANEPAIRGKLELDYEVDPPPDLAIEIDPTRPRRDRLGVYAGIGVPEVWTFDGETLVGYGLVDEQYEVIEPSRSFPTLRIADLLPFVQRRHETEEGALMRTFREWVRKTIVP